MYSTSRSTMVMLGMGWATGGKCSVSVLEDNSIIVQRVLEWGKLIGGGDGGK